jgi:uncharacterized protein (DUF488 family)
MKVYTIGYGGRKFEEFIKVLKEHRIKTVVDVRAFPSSKYEPFNKESLQILLPKEGIKYIHLEKLGGYKKPSYEEYMKTEEFKSGIRQLLEEARKKKVVIMCLERSPKACHRRFISKALEDHRVEIIHL